MLVWEYIKAIFAQWWPLMSCAAFTILAIGSGWLKKTDFWLTKASIVLAVIFLFIIAPYFAWLDEHQRLVETTAQLVTLKVPQLGGWIYVLGAQGKSGEMLIASGVITNKGAPTILTAWHLDIRYPDGHIVHGCMIATPDNAMHLTGRNNPQQTFALHSDEYWMRDSTDNPIHDRRGATRVDSRLF